MSTEFYDYIIVGAGSAGCVVANRLVEDSDVSVLLLEAGGPDSDERIHVPGMFSQLWGTSVDWNYQTVLEPALLRDPSNPQPGRIVVPWPRGKVLGGSGSLSSMIYIRGNRRDYDTWNYLGNEGWSYADVLPYFKKAEHQERGANEFHGVDGPMAVSDIHPPNPVSLAFVQAAIAAGYNANDDFNGEQQEGAGPFQVNIHYDPTNPDYTGRRVSSADAYLNPIKERTNFNLQTDAVVNRLLLDGRRVLGVEYQNTGNGSRIVRAKREVIVCCGSVNSPKLLMLSGIGPEAHLREKGIPVSVDLPGVGRNLQDHPIAAVGYRYSGDKKSAPPAAGAVESGLFAHSRGNLAASPPDLQFHFTHWLLINQQFFAPELTPLDGFAVVVTLVRPQSTGSIRLQSAQPEDQPVIRGNYLQSQTDVNAVLAGIKIARALVGQEAFNSFRGEEIAPGRDRQSDEQLREYIRLAAANLFHPVGTCKMGRDAMAVVDPQLRVHGINNLRVVDASIMPLIPSGNTHAPTVMIAEKAADMIKNSGRHSTES